MSGCDAATSSLQPVLDERIHVVTTFIKVFFEFTKIEFLAQKQKGRRAIALRPFLNSLREIA